MQVLWVGIHLEHNQIDQTQLQKLESNLKLDIAPQNKNIQKLSQVASLKLTSKAPKNGWSWKMIVSFWGSFPGRCELLVSGSVSSISSFSSRFYCVI